MSLVYIIHLIDEKESGLVIKIWDQEVYSICGFRFELCNYLYNNHWRFTWSLISGPVGLVKVRIN
jgi:hypothetical protein